MSSWLFWDVTHRRLADSYRRFVITCRFHLQGTDRLPQTALSNCQSTPHNTPEERSCRTNSVCKETTFHWHRITLQILSDLQGKFLDRLGSMLRSSQQSTQSRVQRHDPRLLLNTHTHTNACADGMAGSTLVTFKWPLTDLFMLSK